MKKFKTKKTFKINNAIRTVFESLDMSINAILICADENVWDNQKKHKEFIKDRIYDLGRDSKNTLFGMELLGAISYKEYSKIYVVRIDRRIADAITKINNIEF